MKHIPQLVFKDTHVAWYRLLRRHTKSGEWDWLYVNSKGRNAVDIKQGAILDEMRVEEMRLGKDINLEKVGKMRYKLLNSLIWDDL